MPYLITVVILHYANILGYFQTLMEDEPEKYQSHFSEYIKKGINPDTLEEMYKRVHAAIRADPSVKKSEKPAPKEHKRYNTISAFQDSL